MKSFSINGGSDANYECKSSIWAVYADLQKAMMKNSKDECQELIALMDLIIDDILENSESGALTTFAEELRSSVMKSCKRELLIGVLC